MHDYAALGLTLRRHPLALLRPRLERWRLKTADQLRDLPHGRRVRACGLVIGRQQPGTAKGTIFVTLEDETGTVNVIVWPALKERQRRELVRHGGRRGSFLVEGHDLPGLLVFQQHAQDLVVEPVPGLVRRIRREQGVAAQIEVADGVQHLVLDELVAVAEAIGVEHTVLIEHDGVVEAAPLCQAVLSQPLDFLHETEGTRARHFAHIGLFGEIDSHFLPGAINRRMIEKNGEIQTVTVVWVEARPLVARTVALAHFDAAFDTDELLGHRQIGRAHV